MQSHFLPCVLLKRFGDGIGRDATVYVVSADGGTARKQKVHKVAKENDLYALDDDLLKHVQVENLPEEYRGRNGLEAALGDVEHAAGLSLDRIESSRSLPADTDDRYVLLWFLARLLCLNPRYLHHIHSQSGLAASFDQTRTQVIGVALHQHENLMTFLGRCALVLYDFRQCGPVLVCGDLPVVSIPPQVLSDDGTPPRIMLPLTSDLLLVAEEGTGDEVREGHMALAGYANAHALYLARREVYSRRRDFPVMLLSSDTVNLSIEDAIAGRGPDVVAHGSIGRAPHASGALT